MILNINHKNSSRNALVIQTENCWQFKYLDVDGERNVKYIKSLGSSQKNILRNSKQLM